MAASLSAEDVARVCHEANRAYCMAVGDHSHNTWDTAPPWQRDGTVAGVEGALANPDRSPEASHAEWLARKKKEGWKHGKLKAPDLREHPCMVPYDELPPEQWIKDALFLAVVNALRPLTAGGLASARAEVMAEALAEAAAEAEASAEAEEPESADRPPRGDPTLRDVVTTEALAASPKATGEEDLPEIEVIDDGKASGSKPKPRSKKKRGKKA